MIDVSGRQLQSLYPSSRSVGRGGYQPQECLTPVTSVAATSPTAVAMIGYAQSIGRGTAPSKVLDFPYQQQSLQKGLDESRLQNPLLTQLPRQQGDVSEQGTFQSPLHCSEQQEVQICGQLSSSRCPAQLDMVTSSELSSSAVDSFGSAVSSNPASHQLYCGLKVSCPSSVPQLISLTASSVSPTSSSLLNFSSSSYSSSQQQQQQQQVHRKHSSPNHHQSGNSHGLQPQLHHRQQLAQQKLAHRKNLSFPLQPYHFHSSPTSASSAPVIDDSSCGGMMTSRTSTNNSIGSINSSSCGSGDGSSVEVSGHGLSDSCGNTRQTVAYITDKLRRQMIMDSGSPQQRSQREHQESSMLASTDVEKSYSSPLKPSASATNTEPDPWKIKICHSECTGLNATLQSMLSLKLGETLEKKKVYQTLPPSGACTRQSSSLSAPILSHSASSSLIPDGLQTRGYGSNLASDCSVSNSTDILLATGDVGSDNDTIKDTSPGTPPYPPKKKHCRSLSIPLESGGQKARDISAPANNTNYFVALELSPRNSGSVLKPVSFNPVTDDSWSQYQQSFTSAEGKSVLSEVSGISSSTLFSSVTNQPALFSGAFHWPTTADPCSSSPETHQTFAAVLEPISCPSQFNKSVTLLHTPPESPVPRPASVSIVGYHDDDDVENRAFKPVSDMWTGRGYNNSGFSSPSSCSSSSSFPLHPRPHATTVTSQATGSGCFLTMPLPKAYAASSPFAAPIAAASSSPSSSPVKLASSTSCSLPPQTPFWSFQKHRSLSLEDQCSISNSTSPSSFSPSSSILSSPSHPPHHPPPPPPHHYPSHAPHYPHSRQQQVLPLPPPPPQILPTQRLVPPQQQQQLRKTVSASGSTPSVPAACKTSVSNPSSPRRQRIPRCRSQPCVLHDRKAGMKRRRDYDRPTLDFHKMTQTAYGNSICQMEASEQILQNLYQGPKVSWFQQFPDDQTATVKQSLNPMSVSGPVSIEVLRSTCLLPDDHTEDAMSEDAEISAATEAGEAAARAAAAAATEKKPNADECCPNSLRNIRQIDSDDGCSHWGDDDASFERPFVSGRSVGPAGWDPLVYASDESNPSFCGCDDDDDVDDDDEDRMTENEDYYGRDKPPIADLDVDQIENH